MIKQQDFVEYRGHSGPIYWSVDGRSVGTGDDFVAMCQEIYGIGDVPIDSNCHSLAQQYFSHS